MLNHKPVIISVVFFCMCGWICSSPVAEALGAESASPWSEEGPASVFDDAAEAASDNAQAVRVSALGEIDLHVKDLDVSKILQLLSIQSQRNIIASRNVAGTITADLYGVDFYAALDAVLHTNGFGYQEKGNFIYVYTQQELAAIQEAERQMITRVKRLNYITAVDASTFAMPLLSPTGKIAVSGEATAGFEASSGDGGANSFAHADTLIIRDYPENVEEILSLVEELDVRPKQVMIEATVLEAKLTENNAFGVDLSVVADFSMASFGSPLGAVGELLAGTVDAPVRGPVGQAYNSSVGNVASGLGGLKVGIVHDDFAMFLRALDQVTDTTVLANPKLLVLNRQRAKLLVGEKLGYISTTSTDTSSTQTVEFLDTGTELSVRPFIGDDDFIRMEVKPAISTGSVQELANFVVPTKQTEELTTNVMLRSGQTVVLGGLFKETTTVTRKQVPFLGDLPILGAAFQGHDDTVLRNEFIFMITPTIMKDESLYAGGERAKDSIEITRVGARQNLLPWSRTKLSAGHLRQALKLRDEGETKRALWAVNRALAIDPNLVEARRLKEELTGKRKWYPKQSVLDDAVGKMIDDELTVEADPIVWPQQDAQSSIAPQQTTQPAEQPLLRVADVDADAIDQVDAQEADEQAEIVTTLAPVDEPAVVEEVGQAEVAIVEEAVESEPQVEAVDELWTTLEEEVAVEAQPETEADIEQAAEQVAEVQAQRIEPEPADMPVSESDPAVVDSASEMPAQSEPSQQSTEAEQVVWPDEAPAESAPQIVEPVEPVVWEQPTELWQDMPETADAIIWDNMPSAQWAQNPQPWVESDVETPDLTVTELSEPVFGPDDQMAGADLLTQTPTVQSQILETQTVQAPTGRQINVLTRINAWIPEAPGAKPSVQVTVLEAEVSDQKVQVADAPTDDQQ